MEFIYYSDWNQLPDSANALFKKTAQESLFASRPWFENLVDNSLEHDQSMLLACVIQHDTVLAMLPLIKRNNENLRALSNHYTTHYTLLLIDNAEPDILECLVQGLSQLSFHMLRLEPIVENDENIQRLQQTMHASGLYSHQYFRFYNWIHRLQGQSFTEYMAARPAKVCNTIARKQRKLEREHGYHIRLYTTHDHLQQAMADYQSIYQASWKANERFGEFINGLTHSMAASGWLRLAILYINDQPAAAQIWLVVHRKASIFRLAYDETWKKYSPGSILTQYLMEYVIDTDKVKEIDFLTGNERYKQDWMSERRECRGLIFANKQQTKGKFQLLAQSLRKRLKKTKVKSTSLSAFALKALT